MINKLTFSWIFILLLLAGCNAEFARRDAGQTASVEHQAESRKNAFPTFTYRPGS